MKKGASDALKERWRSVFLVWYGFGVVFYKVNTVVAWNTKITESRWQDPNRHTLSGLLLDQSFHHFDPHYMMLIQCRQTPEHKSKNPTRQHNSSLQSVYLGSGIRVKGRDHSMEAFRSAYRASDCQINFVLFGAVVTDNTSTNKAACPLF